MKATLETPSVTIVLLGSFEPALAVPSNLGKAGVIREDEASQAQFNSLVPGQAVDFALTWCNVAVMANSVIVSTATPPFVKIADLIQKTIGDVMPNAFVSKLGINRNYTLRFTNAQEMNEFGMRLAPPSAWGKWGRKLGDGISRVDHASPHGGVVNVTMRELPVDGREAGWRDVTVVATGTVQGTSTAGIALNDHFEMSNANQPAGLEPRELAARHTSALMRILSEQFDASLTSLEAIAKDIAGVTQ